jgi:hypothetical protein
MKIFRALPSESKVRSRFIISALEEKISQRHETEWQPTTARGRRMKAILDKGAAERAIRWTPKVLPLNWRSAVGDFIENIP